MNCSTTLRRLKMSGMLDTLEVRLDQARAGELGHLEFLQVLCEDELTRRDASALTRRVRAARFDEIATLEDFDFAYNPKIPVAAIRDLATLGFVEAHESVIVYGPVGVGKSHIAQALGHLACRRGHTVDLRQSQPGPRRSLRRTRRRILARPASPLGSTRRPRDRRFRPPPVHRCPGRRLLRAGLRTAPFLADLHLEPTTR